ncbi:MAG: DUF488 domain-containing protein [Archaeoglobaceae archaeon]
MIVYTIGHSNRDFSSFLNLLLSNSIEVVVDVRRFPKSKFEHFNSQQLQTKLKEFGIEYLHLEGLGGFRKKGLKNSPNVAIKSPGFRKYADYMLTEEFEKEIEKVVELATKRKIVLMCAEKFFWKCHRKFIADYLTLKGFRVLHIIDGKILIHELSKNARVENGKLIYDQSL